MEVAGMKYISQQFQDGILIIELNRPEVRNAINMGMVEELVQAFTKAESNTDIKVIVVRGAGDKAFSSGGDLIEFHSITTEAAALEMMQRVSQLLNLISSSSKLTISAINGYALGGGAELTTAFDIRIISDKAKIGFIQSTLGITTAWGGGSRLISLLGRTKALPLLIAGEIKPASFWLQNGYINLVIKHASFEIECLQYAQKFARKTHQLIAAYKKLIYYSINTDQLTKSINAEIKQAAKLWVSDEHLQAANQFMQKGNS